MFAVDELEIDTTEIDVLFLLYLGPWRTMAMPLRLVLQAGVRGVASASRATRHASTCLAPLTALAGPAVHPPNHRLGRRFAASAAQAAPTPAPGWHPETSVKHEDEPDARWTPTGTGGYPADWAAINESEWAPGKMVSFILCSDSKLKVHVLGTLGTGPAIDGDPCSYCRHARVGDFVVCGRFRL